MRIICPIGTVFVYMILKGGESCTRKQRANSVLQGK